MLVKVSAQDAQGLVMATVPAGMSGWPGGKVRPAPALGWQWGEWVGPYGLGLRDRTAVLASALIFVGFWLIGVLSQSPHFRSYSSPVTLLTPIERP